MHLQRSHNLTTAEYETKFGEVEQGSVQDPESGFGQHFLITDGGGNLLSQSGVNVVSGSKSRKSAGASRNSVPDSGRLVRGQGNVPCEDCGRMFSTHSNKVSYFRCHPEN